MAAMNMVSAGAFSGVSVHLRRCPQGVASVLCKKPPMFWVPTMKVRPFDGIYSALYSRSLQKSFDSHIFLILHGISYSRK